MIEIIPFVETYSANGTLVASGNLGGYLATALQQTGRFNLQPTKQDLKDLLQQSQIEQSSGFCGPSQPSEAPLRLRPADYLLKGRVVAVKFDKATTPRGFGSGSSSASIKVDVSLVEPRTGKLAWAGTGDGIAWRTELTAKRDGDDILDEDAKGWLTDLAMRKACDDIVAQLVATGLFPIRALVTGVTGDGRVHVDLGVASPLEVGQSLQVRQVSLETDAATGTALGPRYSEVIGELVIEEILLDRCICRLVAGKCQRGNIAEVPYDEED